MYNVVRGFSPEKNIEVCDDKKECMFNTDFPDGLVDDAACVCGGAEE